MKFAALLLLAMFGSYFQASSQKNFANLRGIVNIGAGTGMKDAEVSVQEWMIFIADNHFDSTLFPKLDLLSTPVQLLFLDLKKGQDFEYIKLSSLSDHDDLRKLTEVKPTKKFHEVSKEEFKGITLRTPITAISYTQAKRYCFWLESRINRNRQQKVKIDLPSDSIYAMVNINLDSLNYKQCALYNFANCHCISQTKKNYNEHIGKSLVSVDAFFPTELGLYTLQGNAAEMINIEGKAMGGSYKHYARYSYSDYFQLYHGPADWLGFRYVVTWNE